MTDKKDRRIRETFQQQANVPSIAIKDFIKVSNIAITPHSALYSHVTTTRKHEKWETMLT